jgi:hypothetical protein
MQYPVPQFTDVEDKIIGSLTLKQFGIIFAAGIVIFVGFSVSKSILVAIFLFVIVGIPAIGLAFAQINGRPIYNSIGNFVKFLLSPKVLVFHKEAHTLSAHQTMTDAQTKSVTVAEVKAPQDTQANLKQVQELLRKTSSQENDIADKMR